MSNLRFSAVAATLFVGLTTSASAQSYFKPPIVGVKPPKVSVYVPPVYVPDVPRSSLKPVFTVEAARQVVAAARAEAQLAKDGARAAADEARAAARAARGR